MQVEFKFKPGQKVTTSVGATGIVDSAMIDRAGTKQYFVKTANDGQWWNEEDLEVDDRLG